MNFNLLFDNKNQLYIELKPKERIITIIQNHILPAISHLGFKFVRSRMQLERDVDNFKQCIWFRTNSKNSGSEVVSFAIHLKVENLVYANYRSSFNYSPCDYVFTGCNDEIFIQEAVENLKEWNDELLYPYWYQLHLNDNNKVISNIIYHIEKATEYFLNANSTFENSLAFRIDHFKQTKPIGLLWLPDILILAAYIHKNDILKEMIGIFNDWLKTEEAKDDIANEVEIYKTIQHIINQL